MAKKAMSVKKSLAIFVPSITAVVAIMLALVIAATMFWQDISLWLYGRAQTTDAAVLEGGTALCEDIVEEGVVLLKNEKDGKGIPALPLSKEEIAKVNVFGWAAFDWMTSAFGSGYSNTELEKVKLFPALDKAGIEYNKDLADMYEKFYCDHTTVYNPVDDLEYRGGTSFGSEKIFTIHEPGTGFYTESIKNSIIAHSDVALVVIGRTGSESKDLKLNQVKQEQKNKSTTNITVNDRHYLELATEEEEMIAVAKETCDKVIVILNTANTMETGFIDDKEIDGALLVGITGLTGVNGLINVLRGEKQSPVPERDENGNVKYNEDGTVIYKTDAAGNTLMETVKVSPSGRTADTYAYDILGTNPAMANYGAESNDGAINTYSNAKSDSDRYRAYIDYSEGIYVGYKWYETADKEGFWADNGGYEKVVQYPFGYGLSYSQFEWEVTGVKINDKEQKNGELPKDGKIEVTVVVHNTGDYPSMDVVELYYTPEYISGGIEKAYVNLGAFAKTGVIAPGEADTVKLELTVQSMASYDCYDKNNNGHAGYELDGGKYQLRLMKNSHEAATMHRNSDTEAVIEFTVPAAGYKYDTDEKTGETVENRFTNKDGKGNDETIDKSDLDGSHESTPVKYLTRENFKNSYPQKQTTARTRTAEAEQISKAKKPTAEQLEYAGYGNITSMPEVVNSGLTVNDVRGTKTYDDEIWDKLIAQITAKELVNLISDGYFKTAALPSIEKSEYVDLDGPAGFNTRVTSSAPCKFVAYPTATMLAQTWNVELAHAFGLSVGREASSMPGLKGWYAPGANIHRNPFGGRNGEYYSEDSLLSGMICAGTVLGAKQMGVYSYVKHFAVNDSEKNREGLFTFLTEQTLREIYLRPFELMIKEGGGNALMTSMNRLGRVWSGANYGLMTEIVRNEWGFNGTVVTDWVNASDDYMPPYLGIWAGNDIWLSNGIGGLFSSLNNDATATALGRKVAHDVLWTLVDTENTAKSYDPNAVPSDMGGAEYDLTWIAYVVLVEVALAAGAGVMAYFLVRNILRNKKQPAEASVNGDADTDNG